MVSTHSLSEALVGVYSESLLDAEYQRYRDALLVLVSHAGPGPAWIFRAPGRVNLIGEHTDYNHGYVLPLALDKDIVLVGRPRSDQQVRLWNVEPDRFSPRSFVISTEIRPDPLGDWGNYAKAAAQGLALRTGKTMVGMDAVIAGAQPWGTPRASGLSSSSALVVVTALALATFNGWIASGVDFAHMCSEAEWYVGTRGGIMDHFISVLGRRDYALFLDCRPLGNTANGHPRYHSEFVSLPHGYRIVIANSGVPRQKTRSQYNVRVAECRLAVAWLRRTYPHMTHLRDLDAVSSTLSGEAETGAVASLPERLTMAEVRKQPGLAAVLQALSTTFADDQVFVIQARARHVVSENARVLAAIRALRNGEAETFGRLMDAAHESMSRDYEASCPEVDTLAALMRSTPGVLGARVTGAGWGGCVVALTEDEDLPLAETVLPAYREATGLEANVFVCRSAPGAGFLASVEASAC